MCVFLWLHILRYKNSAPTKALELFRQDFPCFQKLQKFRVIKLHKLEDCLVIILLVFHQYLYDMISYQSLFGTDMSVSWGTMGSWCNRGFQIMPLKKRSATFLKRCGSNFDFLLNQYKFFNENKVLGKLCD